MIERVEGFTVEWSADDLEVGFTVWAETATDREGRVYYARKDATDGMDIVEDVREAEVYAHGAIKWDGCSHVYFNEYLHMCGRGCWQAHANLVAYLWLRAGELMPTSPLHEVFKPLTLACA